MLIGYELFDARRKEEYGYKMDDHVVTMDLRMNGKHFEELYREAQ